MKYKVGDKVRIKSIDWYNLHKSPLTEVVDLINGPNFIKEMSCFCNKIMTIIAIKENVYLMKEDDSRFDWTDSMIEGLVEEAANYMKLGKITSVIFHDQNYQDKVELDLGDYELKQEGDKWFAVKKKSKYPTTYKECCKVLGCKRIVGFVGLDDVEENLYGKFIALKRCRDAYWKIAGEEMKWGKSWEPNWNTLKRYYAIRVLDGEIAYGFGYYSNRILVFPTEEMRDAFYENFKDLIESCKELL